MGNNILDTKVSIPQARTGTVTRTRLHRRLREAQRGKITLLSGQAGSGKTTLLVEWLSEDALPAAWISLDEGDNDPDRFVLLLVTAIQSISPGFAPELTAMLNSTRPGPFESALPFFIHQLARIQPRFVLVLDDFHLVTSPEIQEFMLRLVENQPASVHLVISTRADPPWPLARWRARGELAEIRMQDLRFTEEEGLAFLNGTMQLGLSAEDAGQCIEKTEGWITGLRLAGLSVQHQADVHSYIRSFAGSHRFVFDYLVDEVFGGLPKDLQAFLLDTAILDRFCAPLCDHVRAAQNSREMIDRLEPMNVFLVALDQQRTWYRYHHLFSDLLRELQKTAQPHSLPELHERARAWYLENGLTSEAVRHALAVDDFDVLAAMIEENFIGLLDRNGLARIARWLAGQPEEVIAGRPWLSLAHASILLGSDDPAAAVRWIDAADAWLEKQPGADGGRLRSACAFLRAKLSFKLGRIEAAIQYGRQAFETQSGEDRMLICSLASLLGVAHQRLGRFDEAAHWFQAGIRAGRSIQDTNASILLYGDLVGLYVERGELNRAYEICLEALEYADASFQQFGTSSLGESAIHFRMSTILRHWNRRPELLMYAEKCHDITQQWGIPILLSYINLAIALHVLDRVDDAHRVLMDGERAAPPGSTRWETEIAVTRTQFWASEGKLQAAAQAVEGMGLDPREEVRYPDLGKYRALAQVLLVRGQRGDAAALGQLHDLLVKLIAVIEESGAEAYLIFALILQALAFQAQGKPYEALKPLERAISLGEPDEYLWVFIREGSPMLDLVLAARDQTGSTPFLEALLNGFKSREGSGTDVPVLVDPLTPRETEVLRLLESEGSIPDLAAQLFISVETVRTHIKRIYGKLDVHSRYEAVVKARTLELI